MSAVILDNSLVHYEVFGRGQPVIFLHSWLGSWRYWVPLMEAIADRYRTYAIDFWGFGDSDRSRKNYSIPDYVDQVIGFMRELGIARANLVGHGLGGMVAIRAATERPENFLKVVAACTPVIGESLTALVKPGTLARLFGRGSSADVWIKLLRQVEVGGEAMDEVIEDTASTSTAVVEKVLDSVIEADLRSDLRRLQVPALGIYAEKDTIVSIDQIRQFEDNATNHQAILIPKGTHFPFLDQTNTIARLLLEFFASQGTTPVQIKEQWKRRTSQLEYL
ncbi:MAG: alpha/beta hydrolase [Herpetosiphonaceae bacterium]|nr:MAG: alpha/beta hydrolase [Herpetosiphonaceae bacterium]